MSDKRKELFSEIVKTGSRTYFFDVKQSKEGSRYLVISVSRAQGAEFEHHRVMVFEENIEEFIKGFDMTISFLGVRKKPKSYSLEEIRKQHPRAYTKWTSNEDETLGRKFAEGMKVDELSQFFQRKPGAIHSRLEKLGVKKDH